MTDHQQPVPAPLRRFAARHGGAATPAEWVARHGTPREARARYLAAVAETARINCRVFLAYDYALYRRLRAAGAVTVCGRTFGPLGTAPLRWHETWRREAAR